MLDDAEADCFDVIVVHKLDRIARNIRVMPDRLARLEQATVAFVRISENMDFTTPIGRVILATLSAFAQYYSDNLATETSKGKQERKRQGLYNGVLPFGTTKGEDGVPTLDTAPRWVAPVPAKATAAGRLRRSLARSKRKSATCSTAPRSRSKRAAGSSMPGDGVGRATWTPTPSASGCGASSTGCPTCTSRGRSRGRATTRNARRS